MMVAERRAYGMARLKFAKDLRKSLTKNAPHPPQTTGMKNPSTGKPERSDYKNQDATGRRSRRKTLICISHARARA